MKDEKKEESLVALGTQRKLQEDEGMPGLIRSAVAVVVLCWTASAFGQAYKDLVALGRLRAKEG